MIDEAMVPSGSLPFPTSQRHRAEYIWAELRHSSSSSPLVSERKMRTNLVPGKEDEEENSVIERKKGIENLQIVFIYLLRRIKPS